MNHKMIAIGIYKKLCKKSKPFILLNPSRDESVEKYDLLYVLFPNEPTLLYPEKSYDEGSNVRNDKESNFLISVKLDENREHADVINSDKLEPLLAELNKMKGAIEAKGNANIKISMFK